MLTPKMLFGARIKRLRRTKGWTQEYLAEKMDISTNYLSSIERGKENPTFDMLMNFSDNLEVEMWELFDFGYEVSTKELRGILNRFSKELDGENLKLAVRVLRTLAR